MKSDFYFDGPVVMTIRWAWWVRPFQAVAAFLWRTAHYHEVRYREERDGCIKGSFRAGWIDRFAERYGARIIGVKRAKIVDEKVVPRSAA